MADNSIVIVGFHTEYAGDKAIDYVTYGERFSIATQQIVDRVDSLNPAKLKERGSPNQRDMKQAFFENRWRQIEPAYKAWKDGNETPENGTPISMMPRLNKPQVDALRSAGFKTIEDLATAPDSAIQRIPLPNKSTLKADAHEFLEARKTGAASAEVAELRKQLEAAVEMIAELKAEPQADKPKRGRPPKSEAEKEEAA